MTERTFRYQNDDFSRAPATGEDFTRDYGSGRDYSYSSARDYAAAGMRPRPRYDDDRAPYSRDYRGSYWSDGRRTADYRRERDPDERGFLERAGDEFRSWFGDMEAERRRERDEDYFAWRRQRIAELDRDYDEYRRENARRFANEFGKWRTERQGQRQGLARVTEHMEVIGADGAHVGTVDKVRGDRILLTRSDPDAGGHHHSIPSRWIQSVDERVTLRKTAEQAQAHWKEEERGAMFGEERDEARGPHILERSFSGTY